jgi:hypothetical protein
MFGAVPDDGREVLIEGELVIATPDQLAEAAGYF